MALSFPPLDATALAWFALVPFGLAIVRRRGSLELYLGAFLGGLLFHLAGMDWIRTSSFGTGLSGPRALQWFLLAQFNAPLWIAALWLGRRVVRVSDMRMTFALPLVWLVYEFARRWEFVLLTETPFCWLQLGLSQADHLWLAQSADLGGVWLVTAVVAMVNGLWVDLLVAWAAQWRSTAPHRRPLARDQLAAVSLLVVAGVLACAYTYGEWRLGQQTTVRGPVVWLMPSHVQPLQAAQNRLIDAIPERSRTAAISETRDDESLPDLLLWSEEVVPGGLVTSDEPIASTDEPPTNEAATQPTVEKHEAVHDKPGRDDDRQALLASGRAAFEKLRSLASLTHCGLLVGTGRRHVGQAGVARYNSVVYVDRQGEYRGAYDKMFLVPWNEFTPWLPLPITSPKRAYDRGTGGRRFSARGRGTGADYRFAAAICYDVCFPETFRRQSQASQGGPPDFFVVSSCERIDNTRKLATSILRHARFRAIESRRAILRNVDGGHSGIVTGNGELLAVDEGSLARRPCPAGAVPIDDRASLYRRCGDWLPIGAVLALVVVGFRPHRSGVSAGETPTEGG